MKKTLVTLILTAFAMTSMAFAQEKSEGAAPAAAAPAMEQKAPEAAPSAEAPKAHGKKHKKHGGSKKHHEAKAE